MFDSRNNAYDVARLCAPGRSVPPNASCEMFNHMISTLGQQLVVSSTWAVYLNWFRWTFHLQFHLICCHINPGRTQRKSRKCKLTHWQPAKFQETFLRTPSHKHNWTFAEITLLSAATRLFGIGVTLNIKTAPVVAEFHVRNDWCSCFHGYPFKLLSGR